MQVSKEYATFTVDGFFFGVAVNKVQEVIRNQEMTLVPLAPPVVRGLINLRGEVVTALDMRRRLDLRSADADRLPMNVVVRTDDGIVSLLVDEIGDVLPVDESAFEPPPETISGIARELIKGVFKLDERLLLVLDVDVAADLEHLKH